MSEKPLGPEDDRGSIVLEFPELVEEMKRLREEMAKAAAMIEEAVPEIKFLVQAIKEDRDE